MNTDSTGGDQSKECPRCKGNFYIISTSGPWASASLCSCVTQCHVCHGRGVRILQHEGRTVATPCHCSAPASRVALFNQARVPARFADVWVDDLKPVHRLQQDAQLVLLRHREEFEPGQKGYLLFGPPGIGKTHLLCGLISYFTLEKGISCRFVDFLQLIYDLKKGYAEGNWESSLISPLLEVDVLVIDELGKGKNSEWELEILDELISHRYNSRKTLYGSSNYPPELGPQADRTRLDIAASVPTSLVERLGDRIVSRLAEMCRFQQMDGPDHRRSHLPGQSSNGTDQSIPSRLGFPPKGRRN